MHKFFRPSDFSPSFRLRLFIFMWESHSTRSLTLNLGLRHTFQWVFIIADVQKPIIGADFLHHFGLLVAVRFQMGLPIYGSGYRHAGSVTSSNKDNNNPYLNFPAITQVCLPDQPIKHDVTHHITTTGPPVSARPRRLPAEWLRIARQVFDHMLQLGINRPSSSD